MIPQLESVLTVVDGRVVYAAGDFADESPPQLPVSPDWSPTSSFGGYRGPTVHTPIHHQACAAHEHDPPHVHTHEFGVFHGIVERAQRWLEAPFGSGAGCDCWAF